MSVIDSGAVILRALSLSGPMIGTVYVGVSSIQSMGMNGIIYVQTVADYITIILSAVTLFYTSRNI